VFISVGFVALILAFVHTVYKVSVGGEFVFDRVVRFEVSGCVCGSWFPVGLYFRVFLSPDYC
jgi:hypothetical protein